MAQNAFAPRPERKSSFSARCTEGEAIHVAQHGIDAELFRLPRFEAGDAESWIEEVFVHRTVESAGLGDDKRLGDPPAEQPN
uniref:Uncharacterized protein n=1 Tax=Vaucheria litorea TaxID=109269 RepID=H6WBC4_VAULI|nr:hypothetical protein [Vaucheria litorea]|mmetsp:Transcript_1196/g.1864  ORF Transcript_1196/g.1864 Transcript_1196/m.1864 type:complete len:82 (-) Transcript_1196:840-1085(-)